MVGEVVPFGKYKGQAVEQLVQDRQYVEWLLSQPWFKEKFGAIYTIIVNNGQEPAETPQHNALQARFLDAGFRERFVKLLLKGAAPVENLRFAFEEYEIDVLLGNEEKAWAVEIKPVVADDYPAVLRQIKAKMVRRLPYEAKAHGWPGTDYVLSAANRWFFLWAKYVLLLEFYEGAGATEEQFVEIFRSSGIEVVFLDEI